MAWATPQYSKTRVDDAARVYLDPAASAEDRELALVVINNWRSSHSFPLNTFQATLRKNARRFDDEALIAQRIKRLSSIESKMKRFDGMKLSRMQDIGGCRAVLASVSEVDALDDLYEGSRLRHTLVRYDDYLRKPKESGYRGIHRVYRYVSSRKQTYNGLQIEIQIRSQLEHAWATAVETVGTFIRQALKSSQGEDEWLRFFALMGSAIALREGTPCVPGTPSTRGEIKDELRACVDSLDVISRLRAYGAALRTLEAASEPGAHYFLLELDANAQTLTIRSYRARELEKANQEYLAIERALEARSGADAVLVSVESLASLRRAYPNYFLDTTTFIAVVQQAVK